MNHNSDISDFMKILNEVLDDLDNINYNLNYHNIPKKQKNHLLPPLHTNKPSFYNTQNKDQYKNSINIIQGIAFIKNKKN
jgi:hypothetical protein